VLDRLDPVADAHDVRVLLLHRVHKLRRGEAAVEGAGKLGGRVVERSPEPRALKTGNVSLGYRLSAIELFRMDLRW